MPSDARPLSASCSSYAPFSLDRDADVGTKGHGCAPPALLNGIPHVGEGLSFCLRLDLVVQSRGGEITSRLCGFLAFLWTRAAPCLARAN